MVDVSLVNLQKLQTVRIAVSDILIALQNDRELAESPIIASLQARHEVLQCFNELTGARLLAETNAQPWLLFATYYSRYLALATDCINFCTSLPPAKATRFVALIGPCMERLNSLN